MCQEVFLRRKFMFTHLYQIYRNEGLEYYCFYINLNVSLIYVSISSVDKINSSEYFYFPFSYICSFIPFLNHSHL